MSWRLTDPYHPDEAAPAEETFLGRRVQSSSLNQRVADAEGTPQAPKSNEELEKQLQEIKTNIRHLQADVNTLKLQKGISFGGTRKNKKRSRRHKKRRGKKTRRHISKRYKR